MIDFVQVLQTSSRDDLSRSGGQIGQSETNCTQQIQGSLLLTSVTLPETLPGKKGWKREREQNKDERQQILYFISW